MASPVVFFALLVLQCALLLLGSGSCSADAAAVPAVYVFGDSVADVGNNNHLEFSLLKANFPHNGIDYPGRKATGRFSNGKNFADFLAEKLNISTSPPYLSLSKSSNNVNVFLTGINFASGGAGISNSINSDQCITFDKQIDYFSTVYGVIVQQLGAAQAKTRLAESMFVIVIGSNDLLNHTKSSSANKLKNPPQNFVGSLVLTLQGQLRRLYTLGARKIVFIGTGPLGCCPSLRQQNKSEDCNAEANNVSVQYNQAVASLLQQMRTQLGDMSYSFFDTSSALLQYIQQPQAYGFVEVKVACCGLGDLNAKIACLPISSYCADRTSYIFWDFYHPTQITAGLLTGTAFDGSAPYVYPMNIRQLSAL